MTTSFCFRHPQAIKINENLRRTRHQRGIFPVQPCKSTYGNKHLITWSARESKNKGTRPGRRFHSWQLLSGRTRLSQSESQDGLAKVFADYLTTMNCTRCLTAVSPTVSNIQQLNLAHIGLEETLNKLNCANCQVCVYISVSAEGWEDVDALLHKSKRSAGNGWEAIEEKDELLKLYVLGQVVYNEIEGRIDDSHVVFDFPDKSDLVKILWKDGNAIGFYTLKLKDSIVLDTMEAYGMTTLDTAYVRKDQRGQGWGLSILEDIVRFFPDEDIGISTPISLSMYYVLNKFLKLNPSYKTKIWEISGVGSEGNRKLVYFSLKKLFGS